MLVITNAVQIPYFFGFDYVSPEGEEEDRRPRKKETKPAEIDFRMRVLENIRPRRVDRKTERPKQDQLCVNPIS